MDGFFWNISSLSQLCPSFLIQPELAMFTKPYVDEVKSVCLILKNTQLGYVFLGIFLWHIHFWPTEVLKALWKKSYPVWFLNSWAPWYLPVILKLWNVLHHSRVQRNTPFCVSRAFHTPRTQFKIGKLSLLCHIYILNFFLQSSEWRGHGGRAKFACLIPLHVLTKYI